jgi:large subunit ribosomal protein L19
LRGRKTELDLKLSSPFGLKQGETKMNHIINAVEEEMLRKDLVGFEPGDTVKVQVKVKEGEKERLQAFEGVVMRIRRGGLGSSFTVRKVTYGVGVERTFPLHSPMIEKVEVVRRGLVRRAKL